jgi:ethanolamine utilization protein EutP (predicted NTPase)
MKVKRLKSEKNRIELNKTANPYATKEVRYVTASLPSTGPEKLFSLASCSNRGLMKQVSTLVQVVTGSLMGKKRAVRSQQAVRWNNKYMLSPHAIIMDGTDHHVIVCPSQIYYYKATKKIVYRTKNIQGKQDESQVKY